MDLISVIVPIYKVEAYLDRCIRSIVDQTYKDLEIILVDDGSPDGCPAICDAWAERDSRIKVVHKENGGLSDARNAGMTVAVGELISFIDSDDTIEPAFLEKLYNAMQTHGADIAECAVCHVDGNGNVLRQRSAAPMPVMDKIEALRRLVAEDGIYQTVWNKLYRRHAVTGIPFEAGRYNEDEFWTWRVFERIATMAVVPDCLYNYLQRDSSIMGVGYNVRRLDGIRAQLQRMEALQKYPELAVMTRETLMMQCLWQYQCASRLMQGPEREQTLRWIRAQWDRIPATAWRDMTLAFRHRIWLRLFCIAPDLAVWIRNLMKIGM